MKARYQNLKEGSKTYYLDDMIVYIENHENSTYTQKITNE